MSDVIRDILSTLCLLLFIHILCCHVCFLSVHLFLCPFILCLLFNISPVLCVFPFLLLCIHIVCVRVWFSVGVFEFGPQGDEKQASDLVGAVNQSHIKAPVVQPIDDQGSGPESHSRQRQFSFPTSVWLCVRAFAHRDNILMNKNS